VPGRSTDNPSHIRALAAARERFLTVESDQPAGVRNSILASWWRSRESKVAADRLELRYVRDPDLETPLCRSAEPVLRRLGEQLEGQAVSIVLTDQTGTVLSRQTSDPSLERQLDRVSLAPGFSYSEGVVGTNGIGTALEAGQAMHVFGSEHYAENLEELACAGVPIRHPMTGKTVGVLDLTCWRADAGPLLMTLAKTTAEQIRQALLTEAGMQEIELLHAYLRACKHNSGMVFALNNDVVMMNATTRSTLVPGDQTALLRQAAEALASKQPSATIELPSGVQVRLHTHAVKGDGRMAGGVVDAKVLGVGAVHALAAAPAPPVALPGLVGDGNLWRRACAEVESAYRAGGWLVVEGERGTGKLSLLRALHASVNASRGLSVLDAAEFDGRRDPRWMTEARRALAQREGTVILRHLEQLPAVALREITTVLQDASTRKSAWVAMTVPEDRTASAPPSLLQLFPSSVHVPPLRHHIADVERLVPFLLAKLGYDGRLTCSAEAMQVLMRSHWQGNVAQLLDVLRSVVRHRRAGVIEPAHLPPEIQSLNRRRLSTLESLERDAIVLGLVDAQGNKAKAARALGMSRATIYRKIREYGIVS
jgi:sigma-54 dependent transcriptional regulator, acetoin dehydrogenase operon transcriptional activator AcoR